MLTPHLTSYTPPYLYSGRRGWADVLAFRFYGPNGTNRGCNEINDKNDGSSSSVSDYVRVSPHLLNLHTYPSCSETSRRIPSSQGLEGDNEDEHANAVEVVALSREDVPEVEASTGGVRVYGSGFRV